MEMTVRPAWSSHSTACWRKPFSSFPASLIRGAGGRFGSSPQAGPAASQPSVIGSIPARKTILCCIIISPSSFGLDGTQPTGYRTSSLGRGGGPVDRKLEVDPNAWQDSVENDRAGSRARAGGLLSLVRAALLS